MTAALADPTARAFLHDADPVLAKLIDSRPDFRPRAWMDELPPLDAFGTLVFQVAGQQLSVASTRAIIRHLEERFGGHGATIGVLDTNAFLHFEPPTQIDRNHRLLLRGYERRRARLRRRGFVLGRAPLALLTEDRPGRGRYRSRRG